MGIANQPFGGDQGVCDGTGGGGHLRMHNGAHHLIKKSPPNAGDGTRYWSLICWLIGVTEEIKKPVGARDLEI